MLQFLCCGSAFQFLEEKTCWYSTRLSFGFHLPEKYDPIFFAITIKKGAVTSTALKVRLVKTVLWALHKQLFEL